MIASDIILYIMLLILHCVCTQHYIWEITDPMKLQTMHLGIIIMWDMCTYIIRLSFHIYSNWTVFLHVRTIVFSYPLSLRESGALLSQWLHGIVCIVVL